MYLDGPVTWRALAGPTCPKAEHQAVIASLRRAKVAKTLCQYCVLGIKLALLCLESQLGGGVGTSSSELAVSVAGPHDAPSEATILWNHILTHPVAVEEPPCASRPKEGLCRSSGQRRRE